MAAPIVAAPASNCPRRDAGIRKAAVSAFYSYRHLASKQTLSLTAPPMLCYNVFNALRYIIPPPLLDD